MADNSRVDEMIYEMNQSLFEFSCFQFEQVLSNVPNASSSVLSGFKNTNCEVNISIQEKQAMPYQYSL